MPQQCVVCDTVAEAMESHHVVPIQYGGPVTGIQVIVCGVCHSSLHYTAEALCAKKPKKIHYFPNNILQKQITKELIAAIVRAKKEFQSEKNPMNRRKIGLEVPQQMLTDLHKAKADAGFTNLESFIRKVLIDYLNTHL